MALKLRRARRVCALPPCGTTFSAYASPQAALFPKTLHGQSCPGRAASPSMCSRVKQDAASVGFRTAALDVRVERNPLRIGGPRSRRQHHLRRRRWPPHSIPARRISPSTRPCPATNIISDWATRQALSTAETRLTRSGTLTSARRNRSILFTRAFRFSSPSAADATTGFFSTTPGAPGSTSASRRVTPILSAPKAARLTTT